MNIFSIPDQIRRLRTICSTAVLSLLSSVSYISGSIEEGKKTNKLVVDTFSIKNEFEKKLPPGWYASRKDISMYSLKKENGNSFVSVTTEGGCTSIGKQISYSAQEFPLLTWNWRVHKLPINARETLKDKNDSGAALYVIFKGKFKLNNILKYVWSSTLPEGATTESPYNRRAKIIVLKSGTKKAGKWLSESVNVHEDYKRLFGEEPPKVEAIAILSDSDNTGSIAAADYDDIIIKRTP